MRKLTVCNQKEPLGIDIPPTFQWIPDPVGRGGCQDAYRILVASTEKKAQEGEGDVWDSGVVRSPVFTDVPYEGPRLRSKTTYYWAVQCHMESVVQTSQASRFHTGILDEDEWQGQWIGQKRAPRLALSGAYWIWMQQQAEAVQYYRKAFTLAAGKAICQVLVGAKANDRVTVAFNGREQGTTCYRYTGALYDVTEQVHEGQNEVAIRAEALAGRPAGLCAKIAIRYDDGSQEEIVTDKDWEGAVEAEADWMEAGGGSHAWKQPQRLALFGAEPWGIHISLEKETEFPAVLLRREFQVKKTIESAYAYVCGLGFCELSINGEKADDSVLSPFITQYSRRALYRVFDVASLLVQGANVIGAELGNGFYNEIGGVWNWSAAQWRDEPKLLLNLEIRYTDGTCDMIATDADWFVTSDGPITSNSLYYGETYDARKEQEGWNQAGFAQEGWLSASVVKRPLGTLSAQQKAPIREVAAFLPADIRSLTNGSYVITSPEMAAGWIELRGIREAPGQVITLTYGQVLNEDKTVRRYGGPDGEIGFWWPHAYIQQDRYICKGGGVESYKPKFSYKGHQYIQIDGLHGELDKEDVTIYRTSNAVDAISEFECSNPLFNQLHGMMHRAMANNFQGDHCDPVLEKNGWTGDANVSIRSLMFHYDMPATLPGWLEVMEDCQEQYGFVPIMAPTADWGLSNDAVWNTLFVNGVDHLVRHFGVIQYAKRQYGAMRRYILGQIKELRQNDWIWHDEQLGDWVAPIGGSDPAVQYDESISEGAAITGTAMLYGALDYMASLAERLGKESDSCEYRAAMKQVRRAFQEAFYLPEKGIYQTRYWKQIGTRTRYRQTDNLVALAFGLVPEDCIAAVVDHLVADIRAKNYHLDTGCVGTSHILPVLCDYGHEDVAYRIAAQTTYPSWGFWVENGASSTWEMWESTTRSFDHYFLGTCDAWFYTHLAGIREISEGYGSFIIKPVYYNELSHVRCFIETVRGRLAVYWEKKATGGIWLDVEVPFGSECRVFLPVAHPREVALDGSTLSTSIPGVMAVERECEAVVATLAAGVYRFLTGDR